MHFFALQQMHRDMHVRSPASHMQALKIQSHLYLLPALQDHVSAMTCSTVIQLVLLLLNQPICATGAIC